MRFIAIGLGSICLLVATVAMLSFVLLTSQPPLSKEVAQLIPVQYADDELVQEIVADGILSFVEIDMLLCNVASNIEALNGGSVSPDTDDLIPICTLSDKWPFQFTSVDYGLVFQPLSAWLNEGKS